MLAVTNGFSSAEALVVTISVAAIAVVAAIRLLFGGRGPRNGGVA